jgi:putative aldouronate transport system substrate-binding protein
MRIQEKFLFLSLCGILIISACTRKQENTAMQTTVSLDGKVEPLKLPVVDNKISLTFWTQLGFKQQQVMNSWDAIEAFRMIEEKTNVKIEWMHPPVGGEREQLNVLIAAHNLPDIIYTDWDAIAGGPGKMIADEIIIDIDPLVKQYASNLLAYWEKNPGLKMYTYTDEKECYGMPYYWPEQGGYLFHFGYVIRGDWAEKLGIKHPSNVDEWYTYLKAVKTGDPNENGQADELPFIAQGYDGLLETQRMLGIEPRAFFYVENGDLVSAIHQDGYREWLATMRKWYAEGLIDPDVLSTNRALIDNKVLTNRAGAYWSGAGTGQLGLYMKQKQNEGDTVFSLNPVPMPTTKSGERLGWLKIMPSIASGITTANKYPKETVKYFDYFFSDEGHLLSQLGPEGKAYTMNNGNIEFTEYCTNNPQGLSFDSALIQYGMAPDSFTGYQLAGYWEFNISFTPQAASSNEIWGDYTVYKLPRALRFSIDESSTVASITNDIRTLSEEVVSKIILGQTDINALDGFLQQAEKTGYNDLFAIYKNAYQRSLKR